jgi:hypothetical protein
MQVKGETGDANGKRSFGIVPEKQSNVRFAPSDLTHKNNNCGGAHHPSCWQKIIGDNKHENKSN